MWTKFGEENEFEGNEGEKGDKAGEGRLHSLYLSRYQYMDFPTISKS